MPARRKFYITLFKWLLIAALLLLLLFSLYDQDSYSAQPGDSSSPQEIISARVDYYNKHYPHIRFVHIDGGEDWQDELVAVLTLLGDKPTAADYEHPPELKKDMIEVSIQRLRMILQHDIVTATIFESGEYSLIGQPYLCVITLNPDAFVADDRSATRYMLDIPEDVMAKVHPARYLNHRQHLSFTLDHEVFHCLDSYLNGGIPMSEKNLGSHYFQSGRERAADAYAMAKHIRDYGGVTTYARNMTLMRALWMFTDSPNRCTFETIREVLREDPAAIVKMGEEEVFQFAINLRDRTSRSYRDYVTELASMLQAAKTLGIKPGMFTDEWCECKDIETDHGRVAFLANRYRYYYEQLFTDAPVQFKAPALHK